MALRLAVLAPYFLGALAIVNWQDPESDYFVVKLKAPKVPPGIAALGDYRCFDHWGANETTPQHQRNYHCSLRLKATRQDNDLPPGLARSAARVAAREERRASLLKFPEVAEAFVEHELVPHWVPNDSLYAQQWHYRLDKGLQGMNLPSAWDVAKGEGVTVGVIDSGILNHPDLQANVLPGYDFMDMDADPTDPVGTHGTHCAGTIAAVSNNGAGVAGVSPRSKIVPTRGLGAYSALVNAIYWTAGKSFTVNQNGVTVTVPGNANPVKVISMSLGPRYLTPPTSTFTCFPELQDAVNFATSRGILLVASAGNDALDSTMYAPPCNCANVMCVGAHNKAGAKTSYSNYGSVVDIMAPGGDGLGGVLSTVNGGQYDFYTGTSMAAPHISGLAGLIASLNPTLHPYHVESIMKETVRPFPASSGCTTAICGAGLADAGSALERAALTRTVAVTVGASASNTKTVQLPQAGMQCPSRCGPGCRVNTDYATVADNFELTVSGTTLTVRRLDSAIGWGMLLAVPCRTTASPSFDSNGCTTYANVDQAGGFTQMASFTGSFNNQDCNLKCRNTAGCVHWVRQPSTGYCWLSSSKPTGLRVTTDRTTGPVCTACGSNSNMVYTGGFTQIAMLTNSLSDQDCNTKCGSTAGCVYWVRQPSTGNCWLSSSKATGLRVASDRNSGPYCAGCASHINIDVNGGFTQIANLSNVLSNRDCNNQCSIRANCVAWVRQPSTNNCRLSSTRPTGLKVASDRVTVTHRCGSTIGLGHTGRQLLVPQEPQEAGSVHLVQTRLIVWPLAGAVFVMLGMGLVTVYRKLQAARSKEDACLYLEA